MHQLIKAGHLRSDLKERLRNITGGLRRRLLQFLLQEIHVQENRSKRITDFMGHARCQAAEHGKVSGALGFALQTLTFGHFAAQGHSAFLHALFEFVMGLLERLLGLLPRRDIPKGNDAASNVAPGVQQWAKAQEEMEGPAIRPDKGGFEIFLDLASQYGV